MRFIMVAIKYIEKIQDFASFENFDYSINAYKNFKKYNLFYGLNGCGKSTLSRLFDFLNIGKIPDEDSESKEQYQDFYNLKFKLKLDDDTLIDKFTTQSLINTIRVFNSDFVKRNLKLEKATTNSLIYNIGEKSDKLKTKKKVLEKSIISWYDKKNNLLLDNKINDVENTLDSKYQSLAKDLKCLLGLPNAFNKNSIRDKFSKIVNCTILPENEIQQLIAISKQVDKFEINFNFEFLNTNYLKKDRFDELKKILSRKKARACGEKENVINWITEGLNLHNNNHHKCKFCSHDISADLWEKRLKEIQQLLEKDVDFEAFEKDARDTITSINDKIESIDKFEINLYSEQFLTQYQEPVNIILKNIKDNELKQKYRNSLETIKSLFVQKLSQLDEFVGLEDSILNLSYLLECQKINIIIQKNNQDCKELNATKESARNNVINSFLLPHMEDEAKLKVYLEKATTTKILVLKRLNRFKTELSKIIKELNSQTVATKEIEDICEQVFGYKKFSFNFDEEIKSYRIVRTGTSSARNISEGEKTVIAFAYFVACLKESSFDRKNGIVVIDDPISSLDQQYLFNISIVMMREILSETLFNQSFVLTHNFYFYRKIRNFIKNTKLIDLAKKRDWENVDCSIYSIEKDNGKSLIQDASKYLLNYESEYLHLIRKLYRDLSIVDDEFFDVGIGNAIRQVLEIFLSFKCPDEKSLYTRFHSIQPKSDKKFKYLYDLVNSLSHTDEIDVELSNYEYKMIAGKKDIKELFDFIKEIDAEHHQKLEKISRNI